MSQYYNSYLDLSLQKWAVMTSGKSMISPYVIMLSTCQIQLQLSSSSVNSGIIFRPSSVSVFIKHLHPLVVLKKIEIKGGDLRLIKDSVFLKERALPHHIHVVRVFNSLFAHPVPGLRVL